MNTRGIVQLVVLNIGVELGVISPIIFAIFVLMATILTLFTSPILSLLYRERYDSRKLSVSQVAVGLRSIRGSEMNVAGLNDNLNNIDTSVNYNQSRRSSIKSPRNPSPNVPVHDTYVTFDETVNYSQRNSNAVEQQSTLEKTQSFMQSTSRYSTSMTRF